MPWSLASRLTVTSSSAAAVPHTGHRTPCCRTMPSVNSACGLTSAGAGRASANRSSNAGGRTRRMKVLQRVIEVGVWRAGYSEEHATIRPRPFHAFSGAALHALLEILQGAPEPLGPRDVRLPAQQFLRQADVRAAHLGV